MSDASARRNLRALCDQESRPCVQEDTVLFGLPNSELVNAIYQLLPGFVSAWIFFGLTAHPKPQPFERVIQALIFTLIAEALAQLTGIGLIRVVEHEGVPSFGQWTSELAFVYKVGYAILLGLAFASCANTNFLHSWLPDFVTKRTSYPSEWFSAFDRTKSYVYLHLHDGTRLYGWPEEWPDGAESGHFVLVRPEWILPDNVRVPLPLTERFVLSVSEVRFIEFEKDECELDENAEAATQAASIVINYNNEPRDNHCTDESSSAKAKQADTLNLSHSPPSTSQSNEGRKAETKAKTD
ncbi:DUF6338 family protein [Rhodopirellula baltica]